MAISFTVKSLRLKLLCSILTSPIYSFTVFPVEFLKILARYTLCISKILAMVSRLDHCTIIFYLYSSVFLLWDGIFCYLFPILLQISCQIAPDTIHTFHLLFQFIGDIHRLNLN